MKIILAVIFLLGISFGVTSNGLAQASGGLISAAPELKVVNGRTVVTLRIENSYSESISSARAWVFLMDDKGKVLGNQAQWIISREHGEPLAAGESKDYVVSVAATGASQVKILFPRIVLANGTVHAIKE